MSITITYEQGTGFTPRIVRVVTTSNFTDVTTAGWINPALKTGESILPTDKVLIYYSAGTASHGNELFDVSIAANGIITLSVAESDVVLPTTTNHIAVWENADGTLGEDAATAINGGNIQAGLSGTAGDFISYPSTALKGSFIWKAVANTGNTTTTVSNAAMGQATVLTIPDPASTTAFINVSATNPTAGHLIQASTTSGVTSDSGLASNEVLFAGFANPDANANVVFLQVFNLTNNDIIAGTTLFTPTGSHNYIVTSMILDITQSFSDGSHNSALILDVGSNTPAYTATPTIIKAADNSYVLGQAGFTPSDTVNNIVAASPLKLHTDALSDYTGGICSLYITLVRVS